VSDDEREKKSFQPVQISAEASTSGSSRKSPVRRRDDRAERVRNLVNSLTKKCSEQEALIKELEWQLTEELSQSRRISKGISETGKRLESRRRLFTEILDHGLPSVSTRVEKAHKRAESVRNRLQTAHTATTLAEERYHKDRIKAQALEQHLLWRMRPWYNKMMAYLRGERSLNWRDTSPHRLQNITRAAIWALATIILALTIILLVYYFFWLRR